MQNKDLLFQIVYSVLRKALTSVGAALVTHGYLSDGLWSEMLTGLSVIAASLILSAWQKSRADRLLDAALNSPPGTSRKALKEKVKEGY